MASRTASGCVCAVFLAVIASVYSLAPLEHDKLSLVLKAASRSEHEGGALILRVSVPQTDEERLTLLQAKTGRATATLYYDQENNMVSFERLDGEELSSITWDVPRHHHTLLLMIDSHSVKLYTDCKEGARHKMAVHHNLVAMFAEADLNMYRHDDTKLEVYQRKKQALLHLGCANHTAHRRLGQDGRRKRDMQTDEYRRYNEIEGGIGRKTVDENRGDIPSSAIELCDDEVIRQLQFLRETINNLRREIVEQKGTIDNLRGQLQQCCDRPERPRCSGNTCYPGY